MGLGCNKGLDGALMALVGIGAMLTGAFAITATAPVIVVAGAVGLVVVGGSYTAMGISNAIEGQHDVALGALNREDKAVNPVRDEVFQGNEEAYNEAQMIAGGIIFVLSGFVAPWAEPPPTATGTAATGQSVNNKKNVSVKQTGGMKSTQPPKGKNITTAQGLKAGNSDPVGDLKKTANAMARPKIEPASMAKMWQGNDLYPGIDDWKNIVLKKGTKIWGGAPGQSNFYSSEKVIQEVNHDATKLFRGLQVSKGKYPLYRPGMTQYEVKEDIIVGYSKALANTQHGPGGFEQYYVPNPQEVLKPIKSIILTNR
mgnify:CR=1 FL=1